MSSTTMDRPAAVPDDEHQADRDAGRRRYARPCHRLGARARAGRRLVVAAPRFDRPGAAGDMGWPTSWSGRGAKAFPRAPDSDLEVGAEGTLSCNSASPASRSTSREPRRTRYTPPSPFRRRLRAFHKAAHQDPGGEIMTAPAASAPACSVDIELADVQGNLLTAYGRLGFPYGSFGLVSVTIRRKARLRRDAARPDHDRPALAVRPQGDPDRARSKSSVRR